MAGEPSSHVPYIFLFIDLVTSLDSPRLISRRISTVALGIFPLLDIYCFISSDGTLLNKPETNFCTGSRKRKINNAWFLPLQSLESSTKRGWCACMHAKVSVLRQLHADEQSNHTGVKRQLSLWGKTPERKWYLCCVSSNGLVDKMKREASSQRWVNFRTRCIRELQSFGTFGIWAKSGFKRWVGTRWWKVVYTMVNNWAPKWSLKCFIRRSNTIWLEFRRIILWQCEEGYVYSSRQRDQLEEYFNGPGTKEGSEIRQYP